MRLLISERTIPRSNSYINLNTVNGPIPLEVAREISSALMKMPSVESVTIQENA